MSLSTALLATHDWQVLAVLYCCASLFVDKSSVKKLFNTLPTKKTVKAVHTGTVEKIIHFDFPRLDCCLIAYN